MSDEPERALPAPDFPAAAGLSEGYRCSEVDEFVADLERALRHDPPAMAPYEVADIRFHVVRRGRGYSMREVDDYLERAQALLRERHGSDAVSAVEGHVAVQRQVSTTWIYVVALVLVAAIVAFVVSQL